MAIYFVLISIALVCCFVSTSSCSGEGSQQQVLLEKGYKVKLNRNINMLCVFIVAFSIFCVIAFRDFSVGADTQRYLQIFTEKLYGTGWKIFKARLDWGYTIFNNLCGIFMTPRMYIVFVALIFTLMNTKFYLSNSNNFFLSMIFYITIGAFSLNMTGIRQSFAVCFTFIAFYFAKKNKLLYFLITIIVATLFHTSAMCFIITYPSLKVKRAYLPQAVGILLVAISGLLFSRVVVFVVQVLNLEKYEALTTQGGINLKCFIFYFCIICLCVTICIYERNIISHEQISYFILGSVAVFCFAIAPNIYLFDRVAHYFIPYLVVFLSNTLCSMRNKTSRIMATLGMVVLCSVWFGISSIGGSYFIDNYKFGL